MNVIVSLRFLPTALLALVLCVPLSALAEYRAAIGKLGLADNSHKQVLSKGDQGDNAAAKNDEPMASPRITPAQAAELVRDATGGQVMGVTSARIKNKVIYQVKVLSADRMRVVRVDGHTGRILNN